jgi:hypothetical protein
VHNPHLAKTSVAHDKKTGLPLLESPLVQTGKSRLETESWNKQQKIAAGACARLKETSRVYD